MALTANGKPKALVIGVGEDDFEETMRDLARIRFLRAMSAAQEQAERSGTSRMTDEEIDAEIQAARRERRGQ